jgi:tetratricopeptide (TPR) repeat protein
VHYNAGVEYMATARKKAAMADSNFAFNYRATSDAKAKREYEKAVDEFKEAIEYNPNMVEAHNNLGYCYRKLGLLDQSLIHYHHALKIDSTYEQAREYLGETYLALDSLSLAVAQHDWLKTHESIYADTLAQSIELYRLKNVSEKMKDAGN